MDIYNKSEKAALSNSMAALYGALARARGEFPYIPRNRIATIRMKAGGSYSYKYADLADVLNAVTPALAAYGLVPFQHPVGNTLITVIAHESGATLQTEWPIKPMPQRGIDDAQSFQTAVQVAKRYALTAVLGISTEETIEGDAKAHKTVHSNDTPSTDPFIEADGIRAPHGAKVTASMSKAEMAKESARAIIAQFEGVKTEKGLEGVWDRNERFINVFKADYDHLFQDIYDAFNEGVRAFQEDAA